MFNAFQKNHKTADNFTYLLLYASNSSNQIKARHNLHLSNLLLFFFFASFKGRPALTKKKS